MEERIELLIILTGWECGGIIILSRDSGSAAGAFAIGVFVGREEGLALDEIVESDVVAAHDIIDSC